MPEPSNSPSDQGDSCAKGTVVTAPPTSPRARRLASPGWLDGRLVVGVLLVLISVVVGSHVLSDADRSEAVWVLTRPLAAGAELSAEDIELGRVRLFDNAATYVPALGAKPVGYVLRRALGARELLPRDAVGSPGEVEIRQVTVPIVRGHAPPDLSAGQLVDVYVTPLSGAGKAATGPPRLVLAGLTVLQRSKETRLGSGDQDGVVLRASPEQVVPLLVALAEGRIDLVRVPRAAVPRPGQAAASMSPAPAAAPVTPNPVLPAPVTSAPVTTAPAP